MYVVQHRVVTFSLFSFGVAMFRYHFGVCSRTPLQIYILGSEGISEYPSIVDTYSGMIIYINAAKLLHTTCKVHVEFKFLSFFLIPYTWAFK